MTISTLDDAASPARRARIHALVPVAYAAAIALLYGPMLNMFFVSDDFYFLGIVAPARGVSVIFAPLVGRFVRPLVVLMYYLNYHAIGLAPWGYHLATLLAHFVSGWLVFLLAHRLSGQGLLSFLAGLMFIVFAGHSEAVTWPAGIADPLVTVCVLTGLVCYLRALDPGASSAWIAGMFAAVLMATQAKELWVVFPGLLVAHTLAFGWPAPEARRRAVVAFGGTTALVVGYLAMRHLVFGSVTGRYAGLGSSLQGGLFASQARAFVLRSFMPPSGTLGHSWLRGGDLIFWPAVVLAVGWLARGRRAAVLLFTGLALLVALAPVLPLTISVSTSESERFVYLASAFACIFAMQTIEAVFRRRAVLVVLASLIIVWHSAALVRANDRWRASGELTRGIVDSFADAAAAHPGRETPLIFILNLPDNIGGAYTFRNGFYSAVQLVRPDAASRTGLTFGVATQSVGSLQDRAQVIRSGDRRFAIDLGSNRVIQSRIPSSGQYRIESQSPTSYEVEFTDSIDAALVLYLNAGRLVEAGTARGPGLPFGSVDLPVQGAVCTGESIRFAGWALDNRAIDRVTVSALVPELPDPATLGEAHWLPGDRPDVAEIFSGFPAADRASWELNVPCAALRSRGAGLVQVRVVAHDFEGHHSLLGERSFGPAQ